MYDKLYRALAICEVSQPRALSCGVVFMYVACCPFLFVYSTSTVGALVPSPHVDLISWGGFRFFL